MHALKGHDILFVTTNLVQPPFKICSFVLTVILLIMGGGVGKMGLRWGQAHFGKEEGVERLRIRGDGGLIKARGK